MVLYNTTQLEAATNPFTIMRELNALSGGILAGVFLITVALFFILIFRNTIDFKGLILGVSFLTTLVSILMWSIGFIGVGVVLFPVIMLLGSVLISVWSG